MKVRLRKVTSIFVVFCMLLSLMPMNVIALEGGQKVETTTNGAYADNTWSAGGDGKAEYKLADGTPIQLYKTAKAVEGMEDTFDITLKVVTSVESSVKTNSGAVVLVMDISNSMRYCAECGGDGKHKNGCKHYNWKDNSVKDNQKRIYAAREVAKAFLANYAGTDASATRMISVVKFNKRSAIHTDWYNVAGGPGKNSYNTVLNNMGNINISSNVYDGGTNLEAGLYDAKNQLQSTAIKNITSKNVILLTDGVPTFDRTLSGSGDKGSKTFNDKAENQAKEIKNADALIYSVMYGEANERTYTGGPTVGNFLANSIASQGKSYNAENVAELNNAFNAISETISSGCDGAGWTATDPMANMISVVSSSVPENFKTADGATYTWSLTTPETSKVGGVTYYTYKCAYRVTLDVQAKGFVEDKFYPANEKTFLNTEEGRFEFPVPGVKGFLPRTDVSVTKAWEDGDNQDGIRTEAVEVQLLKDGAPFGDTVVLNGLNNWSHKWDDLIKKSEGILHKYEVKEVNVPTGYTPSYLIKDNKIVLTNTHTPEVTGFGVEKVWNDNKDQDGLRPATITVNLLADGKKVEDKTITLSKDNQWKGNFTNLPMYKEGVKIVYAIEEEAVNGYTAQVTGNADEGFIITNSHDTAVTKVDVTKAWNDADDQDGIRPEEVTVQLYADGDEVVGKTLTLNKGNNWNGSFDNLPKNNEGKAIEYTVKEVGVADGYTTAVTGTMAGGFVITNTHTPEKINIPVTKEWVDNDNQDGKRPAEITVKLLANGKEVASKVLNSQNKWTGSFNDMPKFAKGNEITYSVREVNVPTEYAVSVTGDTQKGFTVTNTHAPEKINIPVIKDWVDEGNQDGIRPASITVKLLADGKEVASKVLNADNKWAGDFVGLDKFKDGKEIAYTVEEVAVDGYKSVVTGHAEKGFTITNTHQVEKTSVDVNKVWDDNKNQDGKRAKMVFVQLYANGELAEVDALVLSEDNHWTGKFTNLDKNSNGKPIVYTVKEAMVADGYTVAVTGDAQKGYTITNTHTPEQINIPVTKVWKDNENQDGIQPGEVTVKLLADGKEVASKVLNAESNWAGDFTGLDKFKDGKEIAYTVEEVAVEGYRSVVTGTMETGFTITNTHETDKTSVEVTKVWNDNKDQDGIRGENVTVQLYADGHAVEGKTLVLNEKNNWTGSFTDLDKSNKGKEIKYTVEEVNVADGYTVAVTGTMETGFTITNTHQVEKTSVDVTKVWNDNKDQDGIRPATITVKLLADGKANGKTLVLNEKNNWAGSFTDLDKNNQGKEIAYTVEEVAVEGYRSVVTGTMETGFTITNTHQAEKTSVDVTKVWKDNENQDGIQPGEITVKLLADGKEVASKVLNAENNWAASFQDLDKYKAGEEIAYTVAEDQVEGYTATVEGSAAKGFVITNTHQAEKTSVDVTKVWDDNKDQDGIRPATITVKLLADGKANGKTLVLNEKNNWTGSFTDLDKNNQAKEIAYTVEEVAVEGYRSVVTGTMENGFTITNTHQVEKTSLDVAKVWDDNKDQDGKRGKMVFVQLYANGELAEVDALVLSEDNHWTGKFTNLDKNSNGKPIVYTVREAMVSEGYTVAVTGDAQKGYTITNTHTPEQINIPVTKVWNDNENQDGIQPGEVTVKLLADGKEVASKVLNAESNWAGDFTGLDKFKDGKEIPYTVEEVAVEGYRSVVTGHAENGFTITNTHQAEKTSVDVTKVWKDNENQDGIQPGEITVKLLADGKEVASKVLNAENNWAASFQDLDKYKAGKEIVYTVAEDQVEGYTATVEGSAANGFVITNTHATETISIPVAKVWNDEDDKDGSRPASVTIRLYANGEALEDGVLVLNKDNYWKGIFNDLPKFSQGEEIVYTISEDEVAKYRTAIAGGVEEGFVVTNSHTPLPGDDNLEDPDPDNPNRPIPGDKHLPNTGDDSDQALLFNVALLSISALAALKLRRRKEDEE